MTIAAFFQMLACLFADGTITEGESCYCSEPFCVSLKRRVVSNSATLFLLVFDSNNSSRSMYVFREILLDDL